MRLLFVQIDNADYSSAIAQYLAVNPEAKAAIWFSHDVCAYSDDVRLIENYDELINESVLSDRVVVLSESNPNLTDDILVSLFSYAGKKSIRVDSKGCASSLNSGLPVSIIFVFPGPIVPLNLGSHQRAYNLLSNLKRAGYGVDILIPKVDRVSEENIKSSLLTVAENIYFYKNKKKKYSALHVFARGFEKRVRGFLGKDGNLQDKFSERAFTKPTTSAKRMLNSLYHAKKYSVIIVSYAWMMDVLEMVEPFLEDEVKVVCDTHDVQFERSKGFLNRTERILYSADAEKKAEIRRLNKADLILAISEQDRKVLSQQGLSGRIVNASAGFDYQFREVRARPRGRPLNFGFIGGAMDANVRSLEFIIKEWWPAIKLHSPDSEFFVAGSVSRSDKIRELMLFDEKIVKLGFVKNLDDFYKRIDVSLNPVMVKGGLNFKSVEAVFCGKHLLTNPDGKECLGDDFECTVIAESSEICEFLRKVEFDIDKDKKMRLSSQKKAVAMFGNNVVSKDISDYLASIIS